MNIQQEELSAVSEVGAIYAGIDGGGYFTAIQGQSAVKVFADEGKAKIVGVNGDYQPIPIQVKGSSVEISGSSISLDGVSSPIGSATVGLGMDCPAGTATPTWVKLTINGVPGVIPFYPL